MEFSSGLERLEMSTVLNTGGCKTVSAQIMFSG